MSKKLGYAVVVFFGSYYAQPTETYFMVNINRTGLPHHYGKVTDSSKKRIETLIALWDKRVYFGTSYVHIVAFNPGV